MNFKDLTEMTKLEMEDSQNQQIQFLEKISKTLEEILSEIKEKR